MEAMKSLFVMGPGGSGKTAVTLALALELQERGHRVGYLKPVGVPPYGEHADEDASLMAQVLGLDLPPEMLVPVQAGPSYLTRYSDPAPLMQRVEQAYQALAARCDALLIEGSASPRTMMALGLDAFTLAAHLQAGVLLVNQLTNDFDFDRLVLYHEFARLRGNQHVGSLFNNVSRTILDKTRDIYAPILQRRGYPVVGIIPRDDRLANPTVADLNDVLGGEILEGAEHLDRLVENIVVGAMTLDSALPYLRRTANKAVITGGDRADIATAALETSTAALILTGGLYPSVNVLARAHEKEVPVILVHYDTYTAIERIHDTSRKIQPGDRETVRLAREALRQNCDVGLLIGYFEGSVPVRY